MEKQPSELKYELSPLSEVQLEQKIKNDKKFAKVVETDLTGIFLNDLEFRAKHGTPIMILIIGREGTGRRTTAVTLKEYVKKLGTDANILTEPEVTLEGLSSPGAPFSIIKFADRIPDDGYSYNYIVEPIGINYEKHICRLILYDVKETPMGVIYI